MNEQLARRMAVLSRLIERCGAAGRTAVMKYMYFLTVLRRVQLGYQFTLYSYGPFDSSVLEDLEYAEGIGAVTSRSTNYGYNISPSTNVDQVKSLDTLFLREHEEDIDWVVREFGTLSAADLELASTIIYVDRTLWGRGGLGSGSETEVAGEVQSIKRHFPMERIVARLRWLREKGLLKSF